MSLGAEEGELGTNHNVGAYGKAEAGGKRWPGQPTVGNSVGQAGEDQGWVHRTDRWRRLDEFPTEPMGSSTHITPDIASI